MIGTYPETTTLVLPAAKARAGCENILGPSDEIFADPHVHSPMGVYPLPDGSTSTWHQGEGATPPAHPAPTATSCTTYQSAEIYAATITAGGSGAITTGPTQTGSGTLTGVATQATPSKSSALRSVNIDFGLLTCLTALVGTTLGSLVVLA